MKGRTLVGLIMLSLALILPNSVQAAGSFRVSVKCNNVEVGNTTKCTLTGTASGTEISSFHGKINVSGNASFESFQAGSGWIGEGSNGVIDLYTDTMKSNSFSIGTVTLKTTAVGSGSLTISGIEASDSNFENISGINNATGSFKINDHITKTTTTKKITTAASNNVTEKITTTTTQYIAPLRLTSLTVDNFQVTNENGIYYVTVNQDTTEVNINATAAEGITIIGLGKRTLADGKNVVELVLRNTFDQTATVSLIITKPNGEKEVDTKLSELKIVNYPFTFNPENLEYKVTIPYNINEIYVMAIPKDENVTIRNDGLQVLSKGRNTIVVTSTFGDLNETKYTITITRSYTNLIFAILFFFTGGSFMIYSFFTIKKTKKIKEEAINKVAEEKREVVSQNMKVKASFNGESSVGVGKRIVIPTRVVASHVVNDAPNDKILSSNTPAPQVKVIKTINTNGINQQVISVNKDKVGEIHE